MNAGIAEGEDLRGIVAGTCVVLSLFTAAHAQPTRDNDGRRGAIPLEGVETNPDWVRRPSGDEVSAVYPAFAQQIHADGHVQLTCEVKVDGSLQACRVDSQQPIGLGFGGAALKLTGSFVMRPRMIDGVAVSGAKVNIPIAFKMPPEPAPPQPTGPPPSDRAVELGRRLLVAQDFDGATKKQVDFGVAKFKEFKVTANPALAQDTTFDAGVAAAKAAAYAAIPAFTEKMAQIDARSMSEDQLTAVATFYESPAGRAWSAAQAAARDQASALDVEYGRALTLRLCAVSSCDAE